MEKRENWPQILTLIRTTSKSFHVLCIVQGSLGFDVLHIVQGSLGFYVLHIVQGSLGETLKEARPTAFLGVPRVWEKMQEKMISISKQNGKFKKAIARWAKGVGLQGNMNRMNG